jgi:hypothetical protein
MESAIRRVNTQTSTTWYITVTGTASLTGVYLAPNNAHNWGLAGARARAVDNYMRTRMRNPRLVFNPPENAGTHFADWARHRLGVENDEDRGVYVTITTDSTVTRPPSAPVSIPTTKRWGIRFSSGGSAGIVVGVDSSLFDIADLDNHVHAYYEYSGSQVGFGPEEFFPPFSVTAAGSWTTFETTGPLNVADFEGPARFSTAGILSLSKNYLTVTLPGGVTTTRPSIEIDTGTTFGAGASTTIPGTGQLKLKSRRPFAYAGVFPP